MSSPTYTKAQLLQMNSSTLGVNWISKINTIKEGSLAKIYPTWEAGLAGRIYIALPATLIVNANNKNLYNIM
jgi:hypothetical protein